MENKTQVIEFQCVEIKQESLEQQQQWFLTFERKQEMIEYLESDMKLMAVFFSFRPSGIWRAPSDIS